MFEHVPTTRTRTLESMHCDWFWIRGGASNGVVLFQDFNFGVKYRYALPINNTTVKRNKEKKYRGSFGWMQGDWAECSVVCGGGMLNILIVVVTDKNACAMFSQVSIIFVILLDLF